MWKDSIVLPEWRNQGIAHALLRASREWAEQQGCREFASDRADRVIIGKP
jgi:GNAT superfamily N-acetyltransferase